MPTRRHVKEKTRHVKDKLTARHRTATDQSASDESTSEDPRVSSSEQATWSSAPTSSAPSPCLRPASSASLPAHQRELLAALAKQKYVLRASCGPAYDPRSHVPLPVNAPTAVTVSNEFLTAKLKLRIRNFRGLPLSSREHTPYFDADTHMRDQYSVAFAFVPKVDIPCTNCRWGNDFDHSVRDRLPPGFNTAFKIVKEFIDPGLACDAYSDKPWLLGPATSCWFVMRVGETVGEDGEFPAPDEWPAMAEGGEGSGVDARKEAGLPDESEKRRKWMLREENRDKFVFEKGRWYQGDFYNPYLDFNNFALKLPGFSLNVERYINDKTHQLRYVFKNIETGQVYFVVVLTLLFGQELRDELEQAERTATNEIASSDGAQDDADSDSDMFQDAPEFQGDIEPG